MSDWFQHCRIASSPTDGNINISSPPASIDGVSLATLSSTDRVLLKHQTTTSQNTTYTYNGSHLVATADVLAPRATVKVDQGNVNAKSEWSLVDTTNYSWANQLGRVNVMDFGAVGNGTTSDAAALAAADTVATRTGATIYLPPGTYNVATATTIASNIEFASGAMLTGTFTLNGAIKASDYQQIITGTNQVVTSTKSSITVTATAPFGLGTQHTIYAKITASGALGTATFQLSWDGVNYFGPDSGLSFLTGTTGASSFGFTIPGLNINLTFPSGSYNNGDVYTFVVGGQINLGRNTRIPVAWFGAKGDNSHDDTPAIQATLSYLSGVRSGIAGEVVFAPDSVAYKVTYTLGYVGSLGTAVKIHAPHVGLTFNQGARILWAGPAGATILDAYGMNQCTFENVVFDGAGTAGCCTWFHTNQQNDWSNSGSTYAGSPTNGNYFAKCTWTGVQSGLYASCAMGDSPGAPANVTVDLLGHTTVTVCAGAVGSGRATHGALVGVNCLLQGTLTADAAPGSTILNFTSTIGFRAGQSLWISDTNGSHTFRTSISSINYFTAVVTINPAVPSGFTAHAATTTISLNWPNALAATTPSPSSTVTLTSIANAGMQVSGYLFEKCVWGGAASFDTTTQAYCYACVAVYNGWNTEQFGFRDCSLAIEAAVFCFFADSALNNELFFDNCGFGSFSAAGVGVFNNFTHCTLHQCGTESNSGTPKTPPYTIPPIGYLFWSNSDYSRLDVDSCEILNACAGNPGPDNVTEGTTGLANIYNFGTTRIANSVVQCGDNVGTPAIVMNASCAIENCIWAIPDSVFPATQTQIPVFYPNFNDLTRNLFGMTNYGQTADARLRLIGNEAGVNGSGPYILKDLNAGYTEIHNSGPLTQNAYGTSPSTLVEQYRANARTTTSKYSFDYHLPNLLSNGIASICMIRGNMRVVAVQLEVTSPFDAGATVALHAQWSTDNTWVAAQTIPASGFVTMPDVLPAASTWQLEWGEQRNVFLKFNNTAFTKGAMNVYVTVEAF